MTSNFPDPLHVGKNILNEPCFSHCISLLNSKLQQF